MRRKLGFTAVALLLALLLGVATAEVTLRVTKPRPRVQVVRLDSGWLRLEERDGVPLWWDPVYANAPVRGAGCAPGQPVVGIVSDSILMSIEPEGDGHRVADELKAGLGDVCVRDGGWAGYRPYQEFAMLRKIHEETPLDVAVFSIWKEDVHFHRFGDALYDSEMVEHDPADGLPRAPIPGVPAAVHRWLLPRSRAWEYATLATAPLVWDARDAAGAYLEAIAWAQQRGIHLVFVEAPPLDAPFAASLAERAKLPEDATVLRIQRAAEAAGFDHVVLAEAMKDQDFERIRLDPCCHYNQLGHAAIAAVLRPRVQAALARSEKPR